MRLYTGTGDQGLTRLFGGDLVDKDHIRVHAYGEVDELNSLLGLARNSLDPEFAILVERVQGELFQVGAELASEGRNETITDEHVRALEAEIDRFQEAAPELRNFVLPGGKKGAAELQVARAVCRRGECAIVTLHRKVGVRGELLRYINRLSDWLFAMARAAVTRSGDPEIVWNPRNKEETR